MKMAVIKASYGCYEISFNVAKKIHGNDGMLRNVLQEKTFIEKIINFQANALFLPSKCNDRTLHYS